MERFIKFGSCAKPSALLPHHHKSEDLRFVQHVGDFYALVRHVGAVYFLTPDDGRDAGSAEESSACAAADAAESICGAEYWPLPSYSTMLFYV